MFYRVGLYSIFLSYSYLGLMEGKPISIEVRNVVFKFPYSILINYFVVTTITRRLAHQTMMNLELIWTRVLGWGFDTIKSRGNYFFVFLRLLKIFKLTIICKIVLRYLKVELKTWKCFFKIKPMGICAILIICLLLTQFNQEVGKDPAIPRIPNLIILFFTKNIYTCIVYAFISSKILNVYTVYRKVVEHPS